MRRVMLCVTVVALMPLAADARPEISRAPLAFRPGDLVWAHFRDCRTARFAKLDPHGPAWSYRDPRSGIDYRIAADRRHLLAVSPSGDVLWRRAPHKGVLSYRVTPACIVGLGGQDQKPSIVEGAYLRRAYRSDPRHPFARSGRYIGLSFDNSQFGYVEIHTGDFIFMGQN